MICNEANTVVKTVLRKQVVNEIYFATEHLHSLFQNVEFQEGGDRAGNCEIAKKTLFV